MRVWLVLALLAGCISADHVAPGSVSYEGTVVAMSWSELDCGPSVSFSFQASIATGKAVATVYDGNGTRAHQHAVEGPGSYQNSLPLDGIAGQWLLEVDRQPDARGNFDGSYNARISCAPQD